MHDVRYAPQASRGWLLSSMALVAVLTFATGCGDDGNTMGAAGGGGPDTMTEVTFTTVVDEVLSKSCSNFASCHDSMGPPAGGLDLATDPHGAMVGVTAVGVMGRTLVVPNDPASSYLYEKITSDTPAAGTRMPQGGFVLEQDKIDLVRAWIEGGALNN